MPDGSDNYERRERAMAFLRGKVLRRTESDVSGGTSGVFSSSETKYALFLFEDDTFRFDTKQFRSVSSGGYSLPSEETETITGEWEIRIVEDKPMLVLLQDGSVVKWWHNQIIDRERAHGLDDERWDRYLIRH